MEREIVEENEERIQMRQYTIPIDSNANKRPRMANKYGNRHYNVEILWSTTITRTYE